MAVSLYFFRFLLFGARGGNPQQGSTYCEMSSNFICTPNAELATAAISEPLTKAGPV
jgi:hypothetical protein